MNGSIRLPLTEDHTITVYGGPYRRKPENMTGVKMAAEINAPCDVSIPTHDFSVPAMSLMDRGLKQAVKRALKGETLYVGCMGGIGRTGLFLAILAKAFGVTDPVKFVRSQYIPNAVETGEQKAYVAEYRVPLEVRARIGASRFFARIGLRRRVA